MENFVKEIIGKINKPVVLNTRFTHLINSLSGIRTFSYLGNQELDSEQLIDSMLNAIIEHLETEEVALYLLEEKKLSCVASLNWEQHIKSEPCIRNSNQSYSLGESVIGKTAERQEIIYIQNCKNANENNITYECEENNAGSLICAPILVNDSVLGVLELSHPEPEHFEAWQEHSIIIYTDLMGMLLHNNKLMQNMRSIVDVRTRELRSALEECEKLKNRYEEMSVIDPLTKLYNRRFFFSEVSSGLARAKRYSQAFSLLLMDLDHFKEINDTHGHECGDNTLKTISEILNKFTREGDTLARFGGEEFVLALPETDIRGALMLAERIRDTVEKKAWECDSKPMDITISIGLSSLSSENNIENDDEIQITDILRQADRALYYVKQNGRNGVKSFTEIP